MSLVFSCANPGSPEGGPRDITPPILVKSNPVMNAKNFRGNEISLYFDEIVVLSKLNDHFVVSPPQQKEPEVKSLGKVIKVKFFDTLQANTTYSLNFGSAIIDNNEGNPFSNFTFSFSTGENIDSLQLSGNVLNAFNLSPMKSLMVGLYRNANDTLFKTSVPLRIAKTDELGKFTITNISPGTYKVFALKETIRNYKFDQPTEEIAFSDSVYTPAFRFDARPDTLWKDSITIDTIKFIDTLVYFPNNILLKTFKEKQIYQNLRRKERATPYRLNFVFASSVKELPKLKVLDENKENWFVYEPSVTGDSLIAWISDSTLYKRDTLNLTFDYQLTDSLQQYYWKTDTLSMIYKRPREVVKKNKKQTDTVTVIPPKPFQFAHNILPTLEIYQPIVITFNEPVDSFWSKSVHLLEIKDTLKNEVKFKFDQSTKNLREFTIVYKWNTERNYELVIDSAAFKSIYGLTSVPFTNKFNIKSKDQYATFVLHLPFLKDTAYVELINDNGEIVRQQKALPKSVLNFNHLEPSSYYVRLFIDSNSNGIWDTGNLKNRQQPEKVFYCNKLFAIKKNWTLEEKAWNPYEVPIILQKPIELNSKDDPKK